MVLILRISGQQLPPSTPAVTADAAEPGKERDRHPLDYGQRIGTLIGKNIRIQVTAVDCDPFPGPSQLRHFRHDGIPGRVNELVPTSTSRASITASV